MPSINLGLIGASQISKRILQASAVPSLHGLLSVKACASRSPQKSEALKSLSPNIKLTCSDSSYSELLEDKSIDAVYISLPNSCHYEWALQALLNGKHVLLEKPITLETEEHRQLANIAKKNGLVLMEAMWWRYHAQTTYLKNLIASQQFGKLASVTSSFCFMTTNPNDIRWNSSLGGGALNDLFCYHADFMTYVLGIHPTDIHSCEAFARFRNNVPASLHAEFITKSNVVLNFVCSIERNSPNLTTIVGDKTSCTIPHLRVFPETESASIVFQGDLNHNKAFSAENAYASMLESFAKGCKRLPVELVSARDSEHNLELMNLVRKACAVEMPERTALISRTNTLVAKLRQRIIGY